MSGNCTRFRVAPVLSALVCAAALLQIGVVGVHTPVHLVLASALAVVTVLAVRVIPPCSIRVDNDGGLNRSTHRSPTLTGLRAVGAMSA